MRLRINFSNFVAVTLFLLSGISFADCIPGTKLLYQENRTRPAIGKDSAIYTQSIGSIPLSEHPEFLDTQIYVNVIHPAYPLESAAIDPQDWCLNTDANQIEFLRNPPNTISLSGPSGPLVDGAQVWVGYFSKDSYNSNCIRGQFLEQLDHDANVTTYESFKLDQNQPHKINQTVQKNTAMNLRAMINGSARNLYGDDWCYMPLSNEIQFLRQPPRIYNIGASPGPDLHNYDVIWLGFDP